MCIRDRGCVINHPYIFTTLLLVKSLIRPRLMYCRFYWDTKCHLATRKISAPQPQSYPVSYPLSFHFCHHRSTTSFFLQFRLRQSFVKEFYFISFKIWRYRMITSTQSTIEVTLQVHSRYGQDLFFNLLQICNLFD